MRAGLLQRDLALRSDERIEIETSASANRSRLFASAAEMSDDAILGLSRHDPNRGANRGLSLRDANDVAVLEAEVAARDRGRREADCPRSA